MTETNPGSGVPARRRLLPLIGGHGGRSAMTCQYRCGNACDHEVPNTSGNPYFGEVARKALSRRGILKGGALGALVAGLTATGAAPATAAPGDNGRGRSLPEPEVPSSVRGSSLDFTPIPPNTLDAVVVPNGYDHAVLISWGDPVLAGAPAFDFERQSEAAQLKQFGYNNDMVWFLPLDGKDRALLVANHEYTNEEMMFRGYRGGADADPKQIRIAMAAHGLSVVEVERVGATGQWRPVRKGARLNRRIHTNTVMELTGPAAGGELLRTPADPTGTRVLGTLNNCAGGQTPWGTVLTAEENVNQYFGVSGSIPAELVASYKRYGFPTTTRVSQRGWEKVDPRFDLSASPNEGHRFGWVVEIDPYDPDFVPRKRTALGRFKHEAANTVLTKDGRVAVYMGDDERFDYIYKFVSTERMRQGDSRAAREHNLRLLDRGSLYVARLTGDSPAAEFDGSGKLPSDDAFDGTGEWIPLVLDNKSQVPGMTVEEVLVFTRLAADKVGPTKMDRPEDIQVSPKTGAVYAALTNNSNRTAAQADEANPRARNRHGHILEIVESRNDAAATTFTWSLPIVCGDPNDPSTYFAGYDKSKVSPISCPDNLTFDVAGNLWISTDGNALGSNDGLFAVALAGPERGRVKQFLTVPVGGETCGPTISDDQRTALVAVQHPGEVDGASPDNRVSTWPHGDQPRPSVVCVWRTQGNARIGA